MAIDITVLVGKVLAKVEQQGDDLIAFTTTDGSVYHMYHSQGCCENVYIESVDGDLSDLVGSTILIAEETSGSIDDPNVESGTWTFYRIGTEKHMVVIRWIGESNGYYSEAVDFCKVR